MKNTKLILLNWVVMLFMLPSTLFAADVTINAEARAYKPDIVYIQPGQTVGFTNMTSHNSVAMIAPEGADKWEGALGENIQLTLEKEGVYGYVCVPHIGFGMVGVIAVGNVTQEMIDAAMKDATDNLEGPFRRLIGKIKQVKPTS